MKDKKLFFTVILPFLFFCQDVTSSTENQNLPDITGYCIDLPDGEILNFFSHSNDSFPLASAVRGGVFPERVPEMSIASMEKSIQVSPAIISIRPNISSDGEIFLLQDLTLDRTTTGNGNASLLSWEKLRTLYLKDARGKVTQSKIPSLREALQWSSGKTILQIDLFNDFIGATTGLIEKVLSLVNELNAQNRVMIVSWSNSQAKRIYDLDSRLPIAIFSLSEHAISDSEDYGIPTRNIVVTTAFDLDKNYIDFVRMRNRTLSYITYFLESSDITQKEVKQTYRKLWEQGVTIQATTRLTDFGKAFNFNQIRESSQYLTSGCITPTATPLCDGYVATIVGTSNGEVIIGTQGRDVIVGLGGNDIITGLKGDDIICGGAGNDIIYSGDGADRIFGGEDNDILYGGQDNDFLDGGVDFDIIDGGKNHNVCINGEQVKRCN